MHKHLLIDTHAWIWFINGDKTLPAKIRNKIIEAIANHTAFIAAISVWEIGLLEAKGRLRLNMPCIEWVETALAKSGINLAPLSPAISIESTNLPGIFHDDPADRMIVATARIENLTLLTRDQRILDYSEQKYVSVLEL